MNKLVIWGASGHAKVVTDVINITNDYNLIGFIDDKNIHRKGQNFCGHKILGGIETLDFLKKEKVDYLIFGFGNCKARLRLSRLVKEKGFKLAKAIHPSSIIANDVIINDGTVVLAGAVINSDSKIGENVIINTSATVDHDNILENGVHISPGVHLGGNVIVGSSTFIGIGTIVKDSIIIGSNSLIGAGSVVVDDVPDNVLAYGVPAKVIKKNVNKE